MATVMQAAIINDTISNSGSFSSSGSHVIYTVPASFYSQLNVSLFITNRTPDNSANTCTFFVDGVPVSSVNASTFTSTVVAVGDLIMSSGQVLTLVMSSGFGGADVEWQFGAVEFRNYNVI